MEDFGRSRDPVTYGLVDSHPRVPTRAEWTGRSLSKKVSMKPTAQQVLSEDPKASTTNDALLKRDSGYLTPAETLSIGHPNGKSSSTRERKMQSAQYTRPNLMVRGGPGGHHNDKLKHKSTIHESGANMLAATLE